MNVSVNATINLHKVLVTPLVLALMFFYDNWSASAFLYLGLHGTYSILWLIKQSLYPDKRFEQKIPVWAAAITPFLPLAGYYWAPYLLISEHVMIPEWVYAVAPMLYTFGIFMHYVGDAQKFYTLRLQKGLITDGLFARTRNPNYLGEILIYSSFILVSWHWQPIIVLAGWMVYFFINMSQKDKSMSRHERFEDYRRRTGKLLPRIF